MFRGLYLRVRLQTDTPVYSILDCDGRINVLGPRIFTKVTPVDLRRV